MNHRRGSVLHRPDEKTIRRAQPYEKHNQPEEYDIAACTCGGFDHEFYRLYPDGEWKSRKVPFGGR